MDKVLYELLGALASYAATQIVPQAVRWLSAWGKRNQAAKVRALLQQLGCASESRIRELVETWYAQQPDLAPKPAQREEIIKVLINLSRNARIQNSQGQLHSSYLRSEPFLEQMLHGIQPVYRKGAPATLNSDWCLVEHLGMGSFGEVWKAANPYMPEPRAIKFFTKPGALEAVRREAENLKHLHEKLRSHRNIVKYYDVQIRDVPQPHIALEYVGGGSLERWLLEDPAERPALEIHLVIEGLAQGLAEAHRQGFAHRDLKPANVVLTSDPRPIPKITDFGLGTILRESEAMAISHGSLGLVVGTSMYLPPEAQSLAHEREPFQDDIFALGVIWYQLLMNRLERPPYDYAEELTSAGADSHTIQLVGRCLARPEHRFQDAEKLLERLEDLIPIDWKPPDGMFNVSSLFREYHSRGMTRI